MCVSGFIGLEDSASVLAVRAITNIFNATHMVPNLFENPELAPEKNQNVIHVAHQNFKEQTKVCIVLMLNILLLN